MNKIFLTFLIVFSLVSCKQQQREPEFCKGGCSEDEANLMMKYFASTWEDQESWEIRAARIKEGMIKGMQYDKMPEISGEFNTIISDSREMDGYIVENIAIESFPGFYITGNLYMPVDSMESYAAVLTPHGHWEDRRFSDEVQLRSAMLARMGAIVFAYDMVGYGESQQIKHHNPIALLLQTWNSKRVLEYLLSRPDVDPERIGMTGASGGATQTFMFTAIDDRIKVSAPVVQVSAHFYGGCQCEIGMPVHKYKGHKTNNVEIAALAAPRPMLVVSDGGDWTSNTPRIEYPYIQKVYALYDAEHKVENVHLATEVHNYGPNKRAAVYNFLARHLRLVKTDVSRVRYDVEYDESMIEILPKEDLVVFGEKTQKPKNLLMGYKAIRDYLKIEAE